MSAALRAVTTDTNSHVTLRVFRFLSGQIRHESACLRLNLSPAPWQPDGPAAAPVSCFPQKGKSPPDPLPRGCQVRPRPRSASLLALLVRCPVPLGWVPVQQPTDPGSDSPAGSLSATPVWSLWLSLLPPAGTETAIAVHHAGQRRIRLLHS